MVQGQRAARDRAPVAALRAAGGGAGVHGDGKFSNSGRRAGLVAPAPEQARGAEQGAAAGAGGQAGAGPPTCAMYRV